MAELTEKLINLFVTDFLFCPLHRMRRLWHCTWFPAWDISGQLPWNTHCFCFTGFICHFRYKTPCQPVPSYKYQLKQMRCRKYTAACATGLAVFVTGELAVPLFLVGGNICTSHFRAVNDLELLSKIASLNSEVFIKWRVRMWRGQPTFQGVAVFKTLVANLSLFTSVEAFDLRYWANTIKVMNRSEAWEEGGRREVWEMKRSLMRACVLD